MIDISQCWCDCDKPIPYRDLSTITARGMLACKKCNRFLNNNWLEYTINREVEN